MASASETKAQRGTIIDHVGPHLGQAPHYELGIDRLADALEYIAGRMEEDNKGKVIAEVRRDEEGLSFTMHYATPVQSLLSEWETDYAEQIESMEESVRIEEGHLARYQALVDKVGKMGRWEKFRFAFSAAEFEYEVAKRSLIPALGPLVDQTRALRDSLREEFDAFRKSGYLVQESPDGAPSVLYPYPLALSIEASAGDTSVTIKVHDQESEEEILDEAGSITNYRAGLMLAGALMARMPAGLEVVLEPGEAEWGYEVPLEEPQDDDETDTEEMD